MVIDLIRRNLHRDARTGRSSARPRRTPMLASSCSTVARPAESITSVDGTCRSTSPGSTAASTFPRSAADPFHWYVFALFVGARAEATATTTSSATTCRCVSWVLDFVVPLGRDHRDHSGCGGLTCRFLSDDRRERSGYFRWGDEPVGSTRWADKETRNRDRQRRSRSPSPNAWTTPSTSAFFGPPAASSRAHRRLKLYVRDAWSSEFGHEPTDAMPFVEHKFRTGQTGLSTSCSRTTGPSARSSRSRSPAKRTSAPESTRPSSTGASPRSKSGYDRSSPTVRSLVVAYETGYSSASVLADRYGVDLITVDAHRVLVHARMNATR